MFSESEKGGEQKKEEEGELRELQSCDLKLKGLGRYSEFEASAAMLWYILRCVRAHDTNKLHRWEKTAGMPQN